MCPRSLVPRFGDVHGVKVVAHSRWNAQVFESGIEFPDVEDGAAVIYVTTHVFDYSKKSINSCSSESTPARLTLSVSCTRQTPLVTAVRKVENGQKGIPLLKSGCKSINRQRLQWGNVVILADSLYRLFDIP